MNNIVMDGTVSTDDMDGNYFNWTQGNTMGTITAYSLGPQPLASDGNETSLASFAALVIPQTVKENEYYLVINNRREYSCYASKDIVWKAGHSYTYEVTITKESGVWVNNVIVSPWTPQDGGSLETE